MRLFSVTRRTDADAKKCGWTHLLCTVSRFPLKAIFKDERFISVWMFLHLLLLPLAAQSTYSEAYTFTTFAGCSRTASVDGAGSDAQFIEPSGVTVDTVGNVYVGDTFSFTIRKITPTGIVSTIAGFAGISGSADGTNEAARFNQPIGVAIDTGGNLYVADNGSSIIRKIAMVGTNSVVTTLAGLADNFGTNDGPGNAARFYQPFGIAVDNASNVYVADSGNQTIRKLTSVGTVWMVSTIAGSAGNLGSANGVGINASFNNPEGVAADNQGNVYVADTGNSTIRKLTPVGTNWMVSSIAGLAENPGDADGSNSVARFYQPAGVGMGNAGNIYVADTFNSTIRMLTQSGANWVVTTFAGNAEAVG
ncbi:MAG TPA: hypothetical protein VMQ67_10150, partial [Candidatus Saccharimonadales bacterium]|nr:hypothetical protein [Candidatus Saccharimonadales bacterium]